MQTYVLKFCEDIGLFMPGYQKGLLTGMMVVLVVLIIMKFFHVLFKLSRYGHCKGVYTKTTGGELYVSVSAVKDIVRSLQLEFKDISIIRTRLYRHGRKFTIKIKANLNTYNANLSTLIPDFQTRLINILGTNLGISNVCSVDIEIKRVK